MRKILMTITFFTLILHSFAYINIYPTTFDKAIDDGNGAKSFYLSNTTKYPVAYRIYMEKTGEKKDMTDWIEYYPKSIKLDVGETKEIKVQITAPAGIEEGEYISNFVVKEVENPFQKRKETGAKLKIYTELKMEIAGYVGGLEPKFKVSNLKISDGKIEGKIKNISEIRSKIEIYLSDGKDEKYLGSTRLLAGGEKELSEFKVDRIDKKYKDIIIRDSEGKLLTSMKIKE